MRLSRFGIVVLSQFFFSKSWPQTELDGIFTLDQSGRCKLLPVWHDVTVDDIRRYSPMLASRVAVDTVSGIEHVAARLFDEIARTRKAGLRTQRKRMIAVQHCREVFTSGLELSAKEVANLVGIWPDRIYAWHSRRWGGTEGGGSGQVIRYSITNVLVVAALHQWAANGVKIGDGIAGRTYYAVLNGRLGELTGDSAIEEGRLF